ncbi:hypothetical protein N7486_010870 [Penicillium sp. IBT 16267x]|nr:hypothetical protein N7486_010870 [Penicillium sp. IBT 16267x]
MTFRMNGMFTALLSICLPCLFHHFSLDISARSIAFRCRTLVDASEVELLNVIGSPRIEKLACIDGTSLEKGQPTEVHGDEEDIRLLDIGEIFLQGEGPEKLSQSGLLRVPETILTNSFDYRVDLWRIGSMVCGNDAFLLNLY